MNCTKDNVEKSILILSDFLGLKNSFEILINNDSLPEVVKLLSYKLFIKKFDLKECSDNDIYNAYNLVHEYSVELNSKGYVNFK